MSGEFEQISLQLYMKIIIDTILLQVTTQKRKDLQGALETKLQYHKELGFTLPFIHIPAYI